MTDKAETTTASGTSPNPRPRRGPVRLAYRVFTALLAVAGLVLLVYVVALPSVVRGVVKSALADLGYPDAVFEVRTASLWAVELADVRPLGGEGEGVIRRAMVRFSPVEVFGGKLRAIELTGADVPVVVRDGQVKFALVPTARDGGGGGQKQGGESRKPLPFERLEVVASTLRVEWEGRQILLPVSGAVRPVGAGAQVELSTFFQGTTIPIAGAVDASGTAVDLTASAENLSVSGIRTVIPWALMSYPFQTSGRVDLRVTYRLAGGRSVARVHAEPKNVWVAAQPGDHQLAVQRVDGSLDVEVVGAELGSVAGTIRVGRVAWDAVSADAIELAVRRKGSALEVEGRLASEGVRITGLKGSVDGVLGGGPLAVALAFDAKGRLPAQVARELNRRGVVTERMGDVGARVEGTFAMREGGWEVDVPRLEVEIEPGTVELREEGLVLARMEGKVLARAKVSAAGASAEVVAGSRVGVGGIDGNGWSTKSLDAGLGVLDVGVVGEPLSFIYRPEDSNRPWRLTLPTVRAGVRPATLTDRASRTNVRGLAGVLNVGGEVTREKVSMVALADSWVAMQSLEAGGGDSAVRVGAARLGVLPAGAAGLFESGAGGSRVAVRLRSEGDVSAVTGKTEAAAKRVEVVGSANLSHGGGPAVVAEVRVDGGAVRQGTAWALADIAAVVPVAWNAVGEEEGTFTVGAASVGEHKLPPVRGTVNVVDTAVAMTAEVEVAKGATLKADGEVEWTPTGLQGRAAALMSEARLEDERALGRVFAPLAGMGVTGTVMLDGQVRFNGPLVKPRITATVKDARLTSTDYDLDAQGVSGSITIDSFDPVSGPGKQRLAVERFRLGKLELSKGSVDFRVERPESLHVERARWGWVGGQVYTYDLRINPSKPESLNAVVYADRLDLKQLLGMVAEGEATGQGQLYGRLPVRIDWPNVAFGQGFLYATGAGQLSVGENAETVGRMLDQTEWAKTGGEQFAEVKKRIIQALRSFNYNTLKMDLVPRDGGLTASVTVVGKGGTGPTAQELNLTVNFNGIDQLLSQALVIRKALESIGK